MKIIHHRASPSSPQPSLESRRGPSCRRHATLAALLCSSAALLLREDDNEKAVLLALRLLLDLSSGYSFFFISSHCCPHASFNLPRQSTTETPPHTRRFRNPFLLSSRSVSRSLSPAFFFIPPLLPLSIFCMSPPPSLVHLTLVTAVLHIHRFSDLSSVPDHLVLHLFQKVLAAGKLTEYVLRMFVATGNDEVLQLVKALRIRPVIKPILPTRCSDKEF